MKNPNQLFHVFHVGIVQTTIRTFNQLHNIPEALLEDEPRNNNLVRHIKG